MNSLQLEQTGYPFPPIVEKVCKRAEDLERRMTQISYHLNRAARFITDKNLDAVQNEIIDALFIVECRK